MGPTLFVSDLHLSGARPGLVDAFHAFCRGPARRAHELYILGDLFDSWLGDDQLREPTASAVAASLMALARSGVPIGVLRGNRDFLLGDAFARASATTLLPEQVVVDLAGTPTLILHGDELCTADRSYQRLRGFTHDRRVQRGMLALPYRMRRGIAGVLRNESRRASARKPETLMDVAQEAVVAAFRRHHVQRMVHGHTHRPARHALSVDGAACERWVLADWYGQGSYLECSAEGMRMLEVGDA
ncbi:MAG: UDP-2,3-diacylglucosamine diphosphatase [Pseudomonadota bacterium]|nr:UDP-2,3-diacylglucosamine diphosphatase [Pseudomonadota bacterium]